MKRIKIDFEKTYIELFDNVKSTFSVSKMTLGEFLNGGNEKLDYKGVIETLRGEEYHSDRYDALKKKIPVGLIGGWSKNKRKRREDIDKIYDIISVDIDFADNKDLFEEKGIEEVKKMLFETTPSCFCAMKSCGGRGLVLYLKGKDITPKNEKIYFNYVYSEFEKRGINIDKQTSNLISRVRIISFDANSLTRNEVEPILLPPDYKITKKTSEATKKESGVNVSEVVEINTIEDIEYLNSTRRYQYCYTLKCYFSEEETEKIVKSIYDKYHYKSPHSKREEAFEHIENSCRNDRKYIVPAIRHELNLLGILNDEPKSLPLLKLRLKDNEWLSDKRNEILDFFTHGFNMLIAGTGVGKTEFWKSISKEGKRILIIEPYGSVIDNKYDDSYKKAKGEGVHIENEDCVVSNYYHFSKDRRSVIGEYDYLVIDESHLIGTQAYRGEDLCHFISAVKKYKERFPESKIILQTASPSNEDYFFTIEKQVEVEKVEHKNVSIEFTNNYVYKTNNEYTFNLAKQILYYTHRYRQ